MSWLEVATINLSRLLAFVTLVRLAIPSRKMKPLKTNHPWSESELHWVIGDCHRWVWRVDGIHSQFPIYGGITNGWPSGICHLNLKTKFGMSLVRKSESSGHSGVSTAKSNQWSLFGVLCSMIFFMPAPLQWRNGKHFYAHVCFTSFVQFL